MSILITGNKGFIASGIAQYGDGIDIKDGVDICNYKATKQYDVVIHTAALISVSDSMKNPMAYFRTNVQGTINMVQQHPESHFIYLSTAGIYGEGESHKVGDPVNPDSYYTKSKFIGEWCIRYFAKSWVILRLTNVIGDGERGEPNVYQVFKNSDILPIYGDGFQTRDFIHVDEVRKVIMSSFERQGIFNVGSGKSKTILDVAREFDKPIKFYPEREGDIKKFGVKDAINIDSF